MLFGDLINTVKQRAAGRTEEERKSHKELLDTPEFIFDETQHQAKHELRLMVRARTHARTCTYISFFGCTHLALRKIVIGCVTCSGGNQVRNPGA